MGAGDGKPDTPGKWGIPLAFYRDDDPPLPPADDPHRVEFDEDTEDDDFPKWILLGMPVAALVIALLNGVIALAVVMLVR